MSPERPPLALEASAPGILVAGDVPLRIWVDDERSPRKVLIRLGVDSCG